MNCWMFPGQPLRHDQPFPEADGEQVAALCRITTGFDPAAWRDDVGLPSEHVRLQLYGTAASLCRARQLRAAGQVPDLLIEHSMGIFAALAVCGSISERDALEMTARVGTVLANSFRQQQYALGCVIGLEQAAAESAAAEQGAYLANYNTSRHVLLAGESASVEAALEACRAAGAFSVSQFSCDAPLHTPLLQAAAGALSEIFADYRYADPALPLLEHISQQRLTAAAIPVFLLDELLQPVWWQRSYAAARTQGCSTFVEIGAGDSLKKFNRWIDSEVRP